MDGKFNMASTVVVKASYSASELAELRLPVLPTSKGKLIAKAARESWPFVETTGVGGTRREYTPPAEVMDSIRAKAAFRWRWTSSPAAASVTSWKNPIASIRCSSSAS